MNKKNVINDFILNILATVIPIIVLQFYIFPILAKLHSGEVYGEFISVYSFFNLFPAGLGTMLNNLRLLRNGDCLKYNLTGDFKFLMYYYEVINIIVTFVYIVYYYDDFSYINILICVVISGLWLAREYYMVFYRINLNYINILINNFFMIVGYLLGFIFCDFIGTPYIIFLLGLCCSSVHLLATTNIFCNRNRKTMFFSDIKKESHLFLFAVLLARITNYADKIMLYPILGGASVSIYYIASLPGKILGMGINPFNSVILSYLAKVENKPILLLKKLSYAALILCVVAYFCIINLSEPILMLVYPQYVEDVIPYISVITIGVLCNIYSTIITPFVLKFFDMKWQIVINGITAVVYIVSALLLSYFYGLFGFCVSNIVSNIVKIVVTLYIFYFEKERVDIDSIK